MADSADETDGSDRRSSVDSVVMYVTPVALIVLYSIGLAFGVDSLT